MAVAKFFLSILITVLTMAGYSKDQQKAPSTYPAAVRIYSLESMPAMGRLPPKNWKQRRVGVSGLALNGKAVSDFSKLPRRQNQTPLGEIAGKNPGGNVAIVEFSVHANVVCSPTPADEGKLYRVKSIHGLRTHSSTNTAAGLRAARMIITSCSGVNKPRVL